MIATMAASMAGFTPGFTVSTTRGNSISCFEAFFKDDSRIFVIAGREGGKERSGASPTPHKYIVLSGM